MSVKCYIGWILLLFLIRTRHVHSFSYNPYCWVANCHDHHKFSYSKVFESYNPYCWFANCHNGDVLKNKHSWFHNTYCWFVDCGEVNKKYRWDFRPYCWFSDCHTKKSEHARDENSSSDNSKPLNLVKSTFDFLGNIVQESVQLGIYSAEKTINATKNVSSYNPYCWFRDCELQTDDNDDSPLHPWTFNPMCLLKECCNDYSIPGDLNKLTRLLKKHVYGQHLVGMIVDAIKFHWGSNYKSRKALVLSFHGCTGSGKNYVSNFIAKSLYKLGTESQHAHYFGRHYFTLLEDSETYKANLYNWMKGNVTNCPKQLFIFDQVDKMPPDLLSIIKALVDYEDFVDGADYSKSIFIFLSNVGSSAIIKRYEELLNEGRRREDVEFKDFGNLIAERAFNEEGAFHKSEIIANNLVDYYIPFLPMEEPHVIECIRDEFNQRGISNPGLLYVNRVLESLDWDVDHAKRFSKSGCKSIGSKVAMVIDQNFKKETVSDEL